MNRILHLLGFILVLFPHLIYSQECTLVCNFEVNVPLGTDCEALITYDMILEGEESMEACAPNLPSNYLVTVQFSQDGPPIPTSPIVTSEYAGYTLWVKIRHIPSGNICYGTASIFDYLPPVITCPPDKTIDCRQSTDVAFTGEATAEDCVYANIFHTDMVEEFDCEAIVKRVTRTWRATDLFGQTSTCQQVIEVVAPSFDDIVFPDDIPESAALDCAAPDISPDNTGSPSLYGAPVQYDDFCNISSTYDDELTEICGGEFLLQRSWTVVNICTYEFAMHEQFIYIKDTEAPNLGCIDDFPVSMNIANACAANVTLPALFVSDNCSVDPPHVTVSSDFGFLPDNGGVIENVPEGTHTFTYTATDDCGNIATCLVDVTVVDDIEPTVVCDSQIGVSLGTEGEAYLHASAFDEGSNDNCCDVTLSIKRTDAPDSDYADIIVFTCEDLGVNPMVTLRAVDCRGNANVCDMPVIVDDQTPPEIQCPPDASILCTQDYTDLSLTGAPISEDNCALSQTFYTDELFLNNCGNGYILRTWQAEDAFGLDFSCEQRIDIGDNTNVTVTFPLNFLSNACIPIEDLDPEDMPPLYDYPIVEGADCEFITRNHTDDVYIASPGSCVVIQRNWTITDDCIYDPNNPDVGIWEGIQRIEIIDTDAPTFTCPEPIVIGALDDDCLANFTLPQVTDIDDCLSDVEVLLGGDLGTSFTQTDIAEGIYTVIYNVVDGCGNVSSCSVQLIVSDTVAPVIDCAFAGEYTLEVNTQQTISPGDFNVFVSDNCSASENITLMIGRGASQFLDLSFAQPSIDLVASCDDLSGIPLAIWAIDEQGNSDYCIVNVVVQDPSDACSVEPLRGVIATEEDGLVAGATVQFWRNGTYLNESTSNADGEYQLMVQDSVEIIPTKDNNINNGLSTYDLILISKHILTTQLLDSPYKIIAADVDNSGAVSTLDVIRLRKVVLFVEDAFPNNTSWRFVPADYEFLDPAHPLEEDFPTSIQVDLDVNPNPMINFVAIKIGDANSSANPAQ